MDMAGENGKEGRNKIAGGNLSERYDNCMELARGCQFYQGASVCRHGFFLTRTSAETILARSD
jgi:hypothetical protein